VSLAGYSRLVFNFSGWERDDGFFTGSDDPIPELGEQAINLPSHMLGLGFRSWEIRSDGNTSYQLTLTFEEVWV
jgi:hypothetical protein